MTEQSTYVCVSYVHVQCRLTAVRHCVQCEVYRPSDATFVYIFYVIIDVYSQKSLIWIIRTISLIRTAYKISPPKGVRITGVGLYY